MTTEELNLSETPSLTKVEERRSPEVILRNLNEDFIEVEMFHVIRLGKQNAEANFRSYLNELLNEFKYEMSRTKYPQRPPTNSHHVILDENDKIVSKVAKINDPGT